MGIRQRLVEHFHEVMKTKTSAHSIAAGFSIGTFIAILPTPGFNLLLGILVVLIFRNISKYSLFIALAIFNPLAIAPLYVVSFRLGEWILGSSAEQVMILDQAYDITIRFLLGNVIIAFAFALITYPATFSLVRLYRRQNHPRRLKK